MNVRNIAAFAVVVVSVACLGDVEEPSSALDEGTATQLVGAWSLDHWEAQVGSESPTLPFGPDAAGRIMYDGVGNMAVQLLVPDRPTFASPDWTEGTSAEVEAACEGFFSYYGDYTLDEEAKTVTHHLEAALFPNWIGTQQVRTYRFEGDTLVLSTPPVVGQGMEAVHTLRWVKIH